MFKIKPKLHLVKKENLGARIVEHRLMLKAAGYHPIPVNGKAPAFPEWQQQIDVSDETIKSEKWKPGFDEHGMPCDFNTGLLTIKTPTFDSDIRHAEAAAAVEKLAREKFADRGRIMTRIGAAPKFAIPFRTETPFKKIAVNLIAPDGSQEKFEFLGDGQQFVGFGVHPDTKKEYCWNGGGEPGLVQHDQLPPITEEEARAFIDEAVKLIEQYGYKRAAATTSKANGKGNGADPKGPFGEFGDERHTTRGQRLTEAALADLASWVPELFPAAEPYHEGFRVAPEHRGPGEVCHCCGRRWHEHQEAIGFRRSGIVDFD